MRYIIDLINAAWDQNMGFPNTVACITDKKSTCAVGIHKVYDTLYLTFRSTKTFKNFLQSANCLPTKKLHWFRVHAGYYNAWMSLKDDILPYLRSLGCNTIVMSGHSLGGAIAGVGALDLWSEGHPVKTINTIGSPSFISKKGSEHIARNIRDINCFMNNNDYVKVLFPWFSRLATIHVGTRCDKSISFKDHQVYGDDGYAVNVLKYTKEV